MRNWAEFNIDNAEVFIAQLVKYSENWEHFLLLNSNIERAGLHLYSKYELIAAGDAIETIEIDDSNAFDRLNNFNSKHKDWIFGHLNYDLKNELENLYSSHSDNIGFPDIFFFLPRYIFILEYDILKIGYLDVGISTRAISELYKKITNIKINPVELNAVLPNIKHNYSKEEYIEEVNKIKNHILKGDIYELNFCTEFFSHDAEILPEETYLALNQLAPAPFSGYYKVKNKYLISSSPERFLKKQANKIISQPIKGTKRRGKTTEEDEMLKQCLKNDKKEIAENVMIVDLVRNDLSRTAIKGSVKVEELCEIYSYKYVHQMISTIVSEIDEAENNIIDVIKCAFPMGSMTGAPKVKAMELIEHFEKTKRGLYSGCVGYISPNKNFDFNVVIRSILYNRTKKHLSFSVGSAITSQSDPEQEYLECLLKAKAMKALFSK